MHKDYLDELLETREERTRTKTFNGVEYTVKATDPYGHWHVVGKVAEALSGSFTTAEKALLACEVYENNKKKKEEDRINSKTIWSTDGKGGKGKRVPIVEHEKAPATVI